MSQPYFARHAACDSYGTRATIAHAATAARHAARRPLEAAGGPVGVALAVGILLGAVTAHHGDAQATPTPAHGPAVITLDDPGMWTPDAHLDTTQVESAEVDTWPLGAGIDAVAHAADDVWAQAWDAAHCAPVTPDMVTAAEWDNLTAHGWHGEPSDGKEALYPPAC